MTTCSMRSAGTPVFSSAPFAATAPRSMADTSLSAPPAPPSPRLPPDHSAIGVRAPPSITTRVLFACVIVLSSLVGRNAGQLVAEHERVNFVGAFVGVDRLQVAHMTHRLVLARDTVGTEDGAR